MKKILLLILLLLPLSAYADNNLDKFNSVYAKILSQHVKTNQTKKGIKTNLVDYKALKQDKNILIASDLIKKVKVKALTKEEKLAFWINAYNFYNLEIIAKNYPLESVRNLGHMFNTIWDKKQFEIDSKKYSLNNIYHEIIITEFKDQRAHFALSCASLSCPDLFNKPYNAKNINKQLEEQTKKFLNNETKGVKINNGRVTASRIFRWYKKEFENKDFLTFIQKYKNIKSIKGYLKFDWSLNSI